MITIRKPLSFTEIGQKDNQEDALWPDRPSTGSRTFILCDGMGGHDFGEIASQTVARALGEALGGQEVTPEVFAQALSKAYDALGSLKITSERVPGTTMACLCLNSDSFLVAHIGDSRIYHIRPALYDPQTARGGILYQSSDHSLVNDLLKAGEITEEEAKNFPQKNVITRAMQPRQEKRHKADVFELKDIQSGDFFFLCCDGVLEQLSNADLCRILADPSTTDEQKLQEIKNICDGHTRDNYSCWLIPIDQVEIAPSASAHDSIRADIEPEPAPAPQTRPARPRRKKLLRRLLITLGALLIASLLVLSTYFVTKHYLQPTPPQTTAPKIDKSPGKPTAPKAPKHVGEECSDCSNDSDCSNQRDLGSVKNG